MSRELYSIHIRTGVGVPFATARNFISTTFPTTRDGAERKVEELTRKYDLREGDVTTYRVQGVFEWGGRCGRV